MSPSEHDLVELCRTLCSVESVIGNEGPLADFVVDYAASMGRGRWPLRRLGNNLVFGLPLRPSTPLVCLLGHLDTVPGDCPPAFIDGDRLVGLGASDMKSGLAIMLSLMARHEPSTLPVDLAFVFYDREEGPYLENGLGPTLESLEWRSKIDLAICLEPSANRLQLGCLGTLHARLTFRGRRAHSARPWEGHNAIHQASPVLAKLAAQTPIPIELGGLVYREVMSATLARGGTARNVVPEVFELNVNYRFAPGRTTESARAEVEALVAGAADVEFLDVSPSGGVPKGNPLVDRLVALCGRPPEAKQAWTDVARLSMLGIDACNLGPGEPAQAHQLGEFVPVSNLIEGLELFDRFLSSGAG